MLRYSTSQAGKEVERLTGADVPALAGRIDSLAGPPPAGAAPAGEDLDAKLGRLVSKSPVVLFMCACLMFIGAQPLQFDANIRWNRGTERSQSFCHVAL